MKKFFVSLLILIIFPFSTSAQEIPFSDVSDSPYLEAILYTASANIVNGYDDGTFRPNATVKRDEFVKIIVNSLYASNEISNCKETSFPDLDNTWSIPYICIGIKKGLIKGYDDGTFRPRNQISFLEAAKILSLSFGYIHETEEDPWYKPYIQFLQEKNAIPTSIQNPESLISREEMVEIIYRLRENIISQPSKEFFSDQDTTQELKANTETEYTHKYTIEDFYITVLEYSEPTAWAHVKGYSENACTTITGLSDTRIGKTFSLSLQKKKLDQSCDFLRTPFQLSTQLDLRGLSSGTYDAVLEKEKKSFEIKYSSMTGFLRIENFSLSVDSKNPTTLSVTISGVLPNECTHIDSITHRKSGNDFLINLTTEAEDVICDSEDEDFSETLSIDVSSLENGTYNVVVQRVSKSFMIEREET